jgi:hypothetical protein
MENYPMTDNRMTSDQLRTLLLPHTAALTQATPALFRFIPGREDHFGSGVLLRVGQTPFLLTAAHVADEFRDMHWKGILFGTPDGRPPISIGRVKLICSKPGMEPNRDDDPLDVAVVELSQEVMKELSGFMRFLTPDDLLLDPEQLKDGVYLVNGFPDSRVERDEMDETIDAVNLPYITDLHDSKGHPIPNFDPRDNVALEAHPPHDEDKMSFGIDLESSPGMSGGGIWRLLDEGQPIEKIDWRKAKLVGIVTERSRAEYTGPVPYIRGTKLREVIKLMLAGWRDLAPILAKSIPPRFVND